MRKEKKIMDSTSDSRTYKIIRTIPFKWDEYECGVAKGIAI